MNGENIAMQEKIWNSKWKDVKGTSVFQWKEKKKKKFWGFLGPSGLKTSDYAFSDSPFEIIAALAEHPLWRLKWWQNGKWRSELCLMQVDLWQTHRRRPLQRQSWASPPHQRWHPGQKPSPDWHNSQNFSLNDSYFHPGRSRFAQCCVISGGFEN